jgi:1A family penicillin-binding protein
MNHKSQYARKGVGQFFRYHAREIFVDLVIFVVALIFIFGGVVLLFVSTLQIPDLSSFEQRRVQQSTKIYDRTGEVVLYDFHENIRRTIVPYEQISRHIKNATVAIEDDTFFEHHGVRPLAIVRALIANMTGSDVRQGGSTITQQVIKNSVLTPEKAITRKIKEAILAVKLEQKLSKEEILSHYLNESPYGGTLYGVEEASLAFFGKRASDVDLAEAAYLAALPQAPTYFSPFGNNKTALEQRKNQVLSQMKKHDFITDEEYTRAKAETVAFKPASATGILAPHFVFYVRDYLAQKYGEDSLQMRGFKVTSSLDFDLQQKAEQMAKKWAEKNKVAYNAENAAIVATDPKTGQILAMVGSRDYFDKEIDGNFNIALAERQPGSSFKPFVYAAAFEKGYTPETIIFDLKTQFSTSCARDFLETGGNCYAPSNYDDRFRGPMTLRSALAQSINVPAVKALYLVGVPDAIKFAQDMGISTLNQKGKYGLTLVLGGGEVKLLDMVGAYGVFANEGRKHEVTGVIKIEDAKGNVVEEFTESEGTQIIDRQVALQISDVLSDNNARAPSYGWNSPLYFNGYDVAAKTGTTNDYRDTWIVGYSPTIAVGAWAGNNDNRSMAKQVAGFIVSPMWREFMDYVLTKRPKESFEAPDPLPEDLKPILRGVWVAGDVSDTSSTSPEELTGALTGVHDILHFVIKDNPRGASPNNPWSDGQYSYWEYPVSVWKNSLISFAASSTEASSTDDGSDENRSRRNRRNRDREDN